MAKKYGHWEPVRSKNEHPDYNVPIKNNQIVDAFRIDSSLKTVRYCLERGCKIVLMSHLGRPNGNILSELSLKPVSKYLGELLNMDVIFSNLPI
mgnify:CR=1 FL=1